MVVLMRRSRINDLFHGINGKVDLRVLVMCGYLRDGFSVCVNEANGGCLCAAFKRDSQGEHTEEKRANFSRKSVPVDARFLCFRYMRSAIRRLRRRHCVYEK